MNRIVKFFHELWEPHCEHCREELEESKRCNNCETLRQQLEISQAERKYFFELAIRKDEMPQISQKEEPEAIKPRNIPWRVRQQMLERESQIAAQRLQEKNKEIEEEIGIDASVPRA